MSRHRVVAAQSQLLIVDIQERLLPQIAGHEAVLRNAERIVRTARILQAPVAVSEQYVKGLGPTVASLDDCLAGVPRVEKAAFSAYAEEPVRRQWLDPARPTVLLAGIESHVCVMQTALDLLDAGRNPVVLIDAIGSRRPLDHAAAVERMRAAGVLVTSTEAVIFEMLVVSGTSAFKQVLPLVKEL